MRPAIGFLIFIAILAVFVFGGAVMAQDESCRDAELNLIFQGEPRPQTSELFDGMLGAADIDRPDAADNVLEVPVAVGQVGERVVYGALVSQLPEEKGGAQGWSLSVIVEGDLTVLEATTEGTAVDENYSAEFLAMGIHGQPNWITGAVLLTFDGSATLDRTGTASVMRLHVAAAEPQPADPNATVEGTIRWLDGLGYAQPVENLVTVAGKTQEFCNCQNLTVRFIQGGPSFRRCDANDDGMEDVSDAIYILNDLFLPGAPETVCVDAADCNDDGRRDISDPIYFLNHFFAGFAPPPPPYGECGQDTTEDELECEGVEACR